ncbi:MAG: helix-turn-helix domain-containing protein [Epsilonproteobacteria bacterium]|nr:helix-turn-helix domain-containing protein [Campylobacterota bacterium]
MKESFVLKWFDSINELLKSLDIEMTEEEFDKIEKFQKDSTAYKREPEKFMQKIELKEYFSKELSKAQRNIQITKAVKDGYTQSEIARFLGLSASGISRILKKKSKVKP